MSLTGINITPLCEEESLERHGTSAGSVVEELEKAFGQRMKGEILDSNHMSVIRAMSVMRPSPNVYEELLKKIQMHGQIIIDWW